MGWEAGRVGAGRLGGVAREGVDGCVDGGRTRLLMNAARSLSSFRNASCAR